MMYFAKGKPAVTWEQEPLAVPVVIPAPLPVERARPEPVQRCRMVPINWFAGLRKP